MFFTWEFGKTSFPDTWPVMLMLRHFSQIIVLVKIFNLVHLSLLIAAKTACVVTSNSINYSINCNIVISSGFIIELWYK